MVDVIVVVFDDHARLWRNVGSRNRKRGVRIPAGVGSLVKDLEGAEFCDPQDVLLEGVERNELVGEVVEQLEAPAAAVAQLLPVGPDLEGDKLKPKLKLNILDSDSGSC